MPGAIPVTAIECIGHADRDNLRGRAYELDISQRRGRAVQIALENEIRSLTWHYFIGYNIPSIHSRIRFTSSGVGSKYAEPAMNETQRLRNRRVSMIFTRSRPQPPPLPQLQWKDLFKGLKKYPFPGPGPARVPYFIDVKYPKRNEWREIIKTLRNSPLRFVDLKPFAEGIIESLDPPENDEEAQERWIDTLTDAIIEEERERRQRTLDPPGDPDDPDD
jgi:hypothetical protein